MMNDIKNSDKQLREKLENFSVQPPPIVWDNIASKMVAQKRKKRIGYISWISAAAVVILAFLAGWFFSNNSESIMAGAELDKIESEVVNEENINKNEKDLPNSEPEVQLGAEELEKQIRVADFEKVANKALVASAFSNNEETDGESLKASFERIKMEFLSRIEGSLEREQFNMKLAEYPVADYVEVLNESDRYLVAANTSKEKSKSENRNGWKMGMHISPAYSSQVSSHTENYSREMTYSGENGNGSIGGGLSIQYKTGKKLRVETGVYYAQNGQSSNNSFELFSDRRFFDNASPEFGINGDYMTSTPPEISNLVSIDNGNIALNSTAGVIQMEATPKGAEIAADFDSQKNAFSNTLVSDGEFTQVFDFIEIPLYLRYRIIDSKFGIEIMGGVNAGLIVGNNAYIDNNYGLQNVGKTQDISTLNFSGTVGVGVNYALGKHLSVAVEPRLNYYLNSINNNPSVDYRPYRIGFYTGLYYDF